jgi:hydrogenase expression/formation protein HypE
MPNPETDARSMQTAAERTQVGLAHGGGGRLAQVLVDYVFGERLDSLWLPGQYDGAVIEIGGVRLAVATDSFVVNPLFFPGGNIGTLAVNGTINDLAMCGARPKFLCAGFILEEGLDMEALDRIATSMRESAKSQDVRFLTGDTKVVNRGKGDGLYINTTGLGVIEHDTVIEAKNVRPGDVVLINGDIGRHGIAIMSSRVGLGYERSISSDCAPMVRPVLDLLDEGLEVRCLRDLTRGGLAGRLNEVAQAAKARIEIREIDVPIRSEVRDACDFLGLDPYHVSNEGRFVAFVAPDDAGRALEVLRGTGEDAAAARIGEVGDAADGLVVVRPTVGSPRILDTPSGENLPRRS